jgi:hypothetical protein
MVRLKRSGRCRPEVVGRAIVWVRFFPAAVERTVVSVSLSGLLRWQEKVGRVVLLLPK